MARYEIQGGTPLKGEVTISGAKNAVVAIIPAALLVFLFIVFFLFHRYTRQTVKLLELLKQQRVSVILVTDPPYEDIAKNAEVLLPCLVDCGGIKNTAVAPVVLMDYLCDAVAAKLGDRSLEYMKNAEALFRQGEIL